MDSKAVLPKIELHIITANERIADLEMMYSALGKWLNAFVSHNI
jgi:hypothetical protein